MFREMFDVVHMSDEKYLSEFRGEPVERLDDVLFPYIVLRPEDFIKDDKVKHASCSLRDDLRDR